MRTNADSLFAAIGGTAGCLRLSRAFYARVDRDPVLRPLFPGKSLRCAIEAFAAFLVQFLGGPAGDSQDRWWLSLRESHLRFPIGLRERDAWLRDMRLALEDAEIPEPARTAFMGFFEQSSAHVVNCGPKPVPPDGAAGGNPLQQEISDRWQVQRSLDGVVAAVRRGDAKHGIELAGALHLDRPALTGLLALMIARRDPAIFDWVTARLEADPALVHERYGGRTLLHAAAAAGDASIVELLLRLGAPPDAQTAGGHTALYAVANECASGGGDVVRMLVHAGADVNACDGVMRCTPLHMAARRGNAEVARALLESGANIDARDKRGDTPLQRARNCRKANVARLLESMGAVTG